MLSQQLFWDSKEPGNSLEQNPMSFHLSNSGPQYKSSRLADLTRPEETFQRVMIAEYSDKSLVLLRAPLKLQRLALVYFNTRLLEDVELLDYKGQPESWGSLLENIA